MYSKFTPRILGDKIRVTWMTRTLTIDPGSVYMIELNIVEKISDISEEAREWRVDGKVLAVVDLKQDKGEVLRGFEEKFVVGIADGSLCWMFLPCPNFVTSDSRYIVARPEFGPKGGYVNVWIMRPEEELPVELRPGQKKIFVKDKYIAVLWHDPELDMEWGLIIGEVKPGFEDALVVAADKVGGMRRLYASL